MPGGIVMKYIKQFFTIIAVCLIGEWCHEIIPLPIPASIYGLVLMLTCLICGVIKLRQVDETATFLVEIMPVMFIPAGAGLLVSYQALKPHLAAISVIILLTTVIVMGVTGRVAQAVMKHTRGNEEQLP